MDKKNRIGVFSGIQWAISSLIVIVLAIAGLACPASEPSSGTSAHEIVVGGMTRTFLVHVPPKDGNEALTPLIIALHGGRTNASSMERYSGLSDSADKFGFVVVYPDGTGRKERTLTWNSGSMRTYASRRGIDDVAFIRALIDLMIAEYGVDPARVYVTGMSNGAMMTYRLAAEIPDRIAAIAPVSGTLDIDASTIRAPMPVLHFHGTEDQYVPYEGGRGPRSLANHMHTSVEETMAAWVRVNGANPVPKEEQLPDLCDDGTRVFRYTYATADDPQSVVLYKIVGGGHAWPGNPNHERVLGPATLDISANEIMWEFFQAHE